MATKSTSLLADMQSVVTNGPAAATLLNCINANGPIVDYQALTKSLLLKLQECDNILKSDVVVALITVTDSTDSANLALLQGLQALLEGTGSPSTQALADIALVIAAGPNGATALKAAGGTTIPGAGPILDYLGMCKLFQLKLEEVKVWVAGSYPIKNLIDLTDTSTDSTNKGLLQNIALVLV